MVERLICVLALAMVATALFTRQDVLDAECGVGCRKMGHDGGQFVVRDKKTPLCACVDFKPYEQATGKVLLLPQRAKPHTIPAYEYSPEWGQ